MDIGGVKGTITRQLTKAAEGGGNTKPLVAEMETAIQSAVSKRLSDLPHVRGQEERSVKLDPYKLEVSCTLQGSPALIKEAVAELVLDLTRQGAKVETEIQATATGKSSWVNLTVDLNGVK